MTDQQIVDIEIQPLLQEKTFLPQIKSVLLFMQQA